MTAYQAAVPTATARLRAAWSNAHAPVPGVPRWARVAAYAIPFTVLPSGMWRIMDVAFHIGGDSTHGSGTLPSWLPSSVYVIILSLFSELAAFTAIGLVAAWGEAFPRWIPFLGGRRVPPLVAVLPGALGAAILTVLWTTAWVTGLSGHTIAGRRLAGDHPLEALHGWPLAFYDLTYAPLLLWGPLLAAVCFAYWRRRRTDTPMPTAAS